MIIDAHTHVGFNDVLRANPKDLVSSMKKARIDRAMVFAGELNACSTERLLKEIAPYRKVLFPVGSVSPLSKSRPSPARVEQWLATKKIHGLKFYPGYEYFFPYEKAVVPYLKILERYRRPAIFHTGDTYNVAKGARLKFAMPLNIDEVAIRFPKMPIIIGHMGNPWLMDAAEIAFKNKNVFYDCSGWVYGKFTPHDRKHFQRELARVRGYTQSLEKMLFGTDWPISDQSSYRALLKSWKLTPKERKKIFSENALEIFGI